MRVVLYNILIRGLLLVALFGSAALLLDYLHGAGQGYCGVGSGCAVVKASAYSHVFGIPLPVFGLAGFAVLFLGASWAKTKRQLRWLAIACTVAACGALSLIGIMVFTIEAVCQYCMAVDIGAIAATPVAWLLARHGPAPQANKWRAVWTVVAGVTVALPLWWGKGPTYRPPPPEVAKLQVPNKITLIAFTDFTCPFCRELHPTIDKLVEENSAKVALRLVLVPTHPGADIAALAYLCAPANKKRLLASELFKLPYKKLLKSALDQAGIRIEVDAGADAQPQDVQLKGDQVDKFKTGIDRAVRQYASRVATSLDIDLLSLNACMNDPASHQQMVAQLKSFVGAGLTGTPSIYVGNFLVEGADEAMLRAALQAALSRSKGRDSRWLMLVLGALYLAAAALWLRQVSKAKPASTETETPSQ